MRKANIQKKASGIYQIKSELNDKSYIGSAVDLNDRKRVHLRDLKNKRHCNIHLQRHYNKYGRKDLYFSILEFCKKEMLIEREQHYLDTLRPEFNICKIAGSSLGVKHSEEAKQKISKANKKNNARYWLGKHFTEETKQKLSKALKGRFTGKDNGMYGTHHSKEAKQKISIAQKAVVYSEERKARMSKAQKGRKFTEEHKKKISIAQTIRWRGSDVCQQATE